MGKTIIHGIKEDGLIDAEWKCTSVLISELINDYHKKSEMEVYHALADIRESAERDARISHTYASVLQSKRAEEEYVNDENLKTFERELIEGGIKAMRKCFEDHHDAESGFAILKLCKAIGGDSLEVSLEE